MDATSWFWMTEDASITADDHVLFNLVDEGYDVWVSSNRGTKYSNVNPRFPHADDPSSPEYAEQNFAKYNFSWYDFGAIDTPALIDKVTEVSGNKKVTYLGYSQGTAQLFYGLATQTQTLNEKLDKAILLAPCLYIEFGDMDYYQSLFPVYRAENVSMFASPTKTVDIERVCKPSADDSMAENRETACEMLTWMADFEGQPIKSEETFAQISISGRFQRYLKHFSAENTIAPLVQPGLGSIKVPIQLVQSAKDEFCPVSATSRLMDEIGDAVKRYTVAPDPEATHGYIYDHLTDPVLKDLLIDQLEFSVV